MLRLDKLLSDAGIVSRQEARDRIRAGRVTVDGETVRRPETKVDPQSRTVCLDGAEVLWSAHRCYMLHKPLGVVTATEDREQKTVLELLPPALRKNLVPVGRLDKDTSGLLLLSDDGDWVHRIISPKSEIPKVYLAETDGTPTEDDIRAFAAGITLRDGTRCLPAKLEVLAPGRCRVTVTEGKYHLVRRLLASVGTPVTALHRCRIGGLALDGTLCPGDFRALTEQEMKLVFIDNESKKA